MTTTQPRSSQSSRRIDSKIRAFLIANARSVSRFNDFYMRLMIRFIDFIEKNLKKHVFTWRVILLLLFVNVFSHFAFKHYSLKSLSFHDATLGTIISYSSIFILLFATIFYLILIPKALIIEFKESIIIVLLEKCWKWIKTNFLTIVFAFALVLAFLFYENKIVNISFSFLRIITISKFGIVLLWGLWAGGLASIIYTILKTATNSTLSDGRTFFLSLILCSLFAYCVTKYPWEMVDPNKVNPEMLDPEKVNPIIGYEWAFLFLFIQYAFCFLILPFIQYFRVALKRKSYIQSSKSTQTGKYLIDSPITSIDEDELFFDNHVRTLKKRIDEIPNTSSHSIAITGGWGTGKTSFLNLLQQKLITENRYEIMWFNPLKSSKSGNIQNDFFDVLENTLSKYKMGFGRRIKYYKELIGAIDNKYISFLVKLGNIQLEEEKKRINDIIKMVPKKIIIIIDDVDRLKSDEIIQVFKLVGFNAEFDNVVFLLALDKMNVIKALSCDYNYPDKFFEMEFPLPNNYRYFTRRYLKNTMEKLVPEIPMPFLDDQTISAYTTYCINNMRDANRFLNNFVDRVKMVNKKLDVRSYYLLSLIQYKDSSLYEKIQTKKSILELQTVSGIDCWALKEDGCSTIDDDTLINIIQDLFPSKMNPKPDSGFIYQSNYFDYYFNDTSTKAITDNKMMELLSSPTEELKTILNPYLNDKMSYQTIKELLERYGKEDFIKSLLDNKDSKLLILNYFKACYIFNADNGLTYSEGLAPVKIGKGKFAYFNELGEVVFTIECEDAFPFSGDHARVRKQLKIGSVNKKGEFKGHLDLKQLLLIVFSILIGLLFAAGFFYSLYKLIF